MKPKKQFCILLLSLLFFNSHSDKLEQTDQIVPVETSEQAESIESANPESCKPKRDWCVVNAVSPKIDWSGYVQFYPYWDTRQVFGFRNGHELLYPLQYLPDVNCKDINARGQYWISPIQSRLKVSGHGVEVLGANAVTVIEGDFFGAIDSQNENFRLRYALITLDWEEQQTSLLLGQYWLPLCPEDHFPRTVDFNGGAPMAIALRGPHAKITKRWNDTELMGALVAQIDSPSNGPLGQNVIYSRNAIVPAIDGHIRHYYGENSFVAAAFEYKRLTPQLVTGDNYKTTETTYGFIAMAFTRFVHRNFILNSSLAYLENGCCPYFFGGYAVSTQDPITKCQTYTPFKDVAWWLDMYHANNCLTVGLFLGAIKDLGSTKPLYNNNGSPILYMFPTSENIDYVWRVAPRVLWDFKPMQFCLELEVTGAAYGTRDFATGKVVNAKNVTDVRFLGAIYYYF